jgi:hypothetical protein
MTVEVRVQGCENGYEMTVEEEDYWAFVLYECSPLRK